MSKYRSTFTPHPQPFPQSKAAADVKFINNEADASKTIANGPPIIFVGDEHNSTDGHLAVIALMPTFKKNHVTALGLELPTQLNPFLKNLQSEIRKNNLKPEDVSKRLQRAFASIGQKILVGKQGYDDMANVIVAATDSGLNVSGYESRGGDQAFTKKMNAVAKNNKSTLDDYDNVVFSMDEQNALNVQKLLHDQGPGNRIAVMGGVRHGCENEKQPRLVDDLKKAGLGVTVIALDYNAFMGSATTCKHPVTTVVDSHNLLGDVAKSQKKPGFQPH